MQSIKPTKATYLQRLFVLCSFILFCNRLVLTAQTTPAIGQWKATAYFEQKPMHVLAAKGVNLYAATTSNELLISKNKGKTWSVITTLSEGTITALLIQEPYLFVAAGTAGLYRLSLTGENVIHLVDNLPAKDIISLASDQTTLYLGTSSSGVFSSTDQGLHFSALGSGLTNTVISSLLVQQNQLYLGTSKGLYKFILNSNLWEQQSHKLKFAKITCLYKDDNALYVGTLKDGLFKSIDKGQNWLPVNIGLSSKHIDAIAMNDSYPYVLADDIIYNWMYY